MPDYESVVKITLKVDAEDVQAQAVRAQRKVNEALRQEQASGQPARKRFADDAYDDETQAKPVKERPRRQPMELDEKQEIQKRPGKVPAPPTLVNATLLRDIYRVMNPRILTGRGYGVTSQIGSIARLMNAFIRHVQPTATAAGPSTTSRYVPATVVASKTPQALPERIEPAVQDEKRERAADPNIDKMARNMEDLPDAAKNLDRAAEALTRFATSSKGRDQFPSAATIKSEMERTGAANMAEMPAFGSLMDSMRIRPRSPIAGPIPTAGITGIKAPEAAIAPEATPTIEALTPAEAIGQGTRSNISTGEQRASDAFFKSAGKHAESIEKKMREAIKTSIKEGSPITYPLPSRETENAGNTQVMAAVKVVAAKMGIDLDAGKMFMREMFMGGRPIGALPTAEFKQVKPGEIEQQMQAVKRAEDATPTPKKTARQEQAKNEDREAEERPRMRRRRQRAVEPSDFIEQVEPESEIPMARIVRHAPVVNPNPEVTPTQVAQTARTLPRVGVTVVNEAVGVAAFPEDQCNESDTDREERASRPAHILPSQAQRATPPPLPLPKRGFMRKVMDLFKKSPEAPSASASEAAGTAAEGAESAVGAAGGVTEGAGVAAAAGGAGAGGAGAGALAGGAMAAVAALGPFALAVGAGAVVVLGFKSVMDGLVDNLGKYSPRVAAANATLEVQGRITAIRYAGVVAPAMKAWVDLKSHIMQLVSGMAPLAKIFVPVLTAGIHVLDAFVTAVGAAAKGIASAIVWVLDSLGIAKDISKSLHAFIDSKPGDLDATQKMFQRTFIMQIGSKTPVDPNAPLPVPNVAAGPAQPGGIGKVVGHPAGGPNAAPGFATGGIYEPARMVGLMIHGQYDRADNKLAFGKDGQPVLRVSGGEAVLNPAQMAIIARKLDVSPEKLIGHLQAKSLDRLPGRADGGGGSAAETEAEYRRLSHMWTPVPDRGWSGNVERREWGIASTDQPGAGDLDAATGIDSSRHKLNTIWSGAKEGGKTGAIIGAIEGGAISEVTGGVAAAVTIPIGVALGGSIGITAGGLASYDATANSDEGSHAGMQASRARQLAGLRAKWLVQKASEDKANDATVTRQRDEKRAAWSSAFLAGVPKSEPAPFDPMQDWPEGMANTWTPFGTGNAQAGKLAKVFGTLEHPYTPASVLAQRKSLAQKAIARNAYQSDLLAGLSQGGIGTLGDATPLRASFGALSRVDSPGPTTAPSPIPGIDTTVQAFRTDIGKKADSGLMAAFKHAEIVNQRHHSAENQKAVDDARNALIGITPAPTVASASGADQSVNTNAGSVAPPTTQPSDQAGTNTTPTTQPSSKIVGTDGGTFAQSVSQQLAAARQSILGGSTDYAPLSDLSHTVTMDTTGTMDDKIGQAKRVDITKRIDTAVKTARAIAAKFGPDEAKRYLSGTLYTLQGEVDQPGRKIPMPTVPTAPDKTEDQKKAAWQKTREKMWKGPSPLMATSGAGLTPTDQEAARKAWHAGNVNDRLKGYPGTGKDKPSVVLTSAGINLHDLGMAQKGMLGNRQPTPTAVAPTPAKVPTSQPITPPIPAPEQRAKSNAAQFIGPAASSERSAYDVRGSIAGRGFVDTLARKPGGQSDRSPGALQRDNQQMSAQMGPHHVMPAAPLPKFEQNINIEMNNRIEHEKAVRQAILSVQDRLLDAVLTARNETQLFGSCMAGHSTANGM